MLRGVSFDRKLVLGGKYEDHIVSASLEGIRPVVMVAVFDWRGVDT